MKILDILNWIVNGVTVYSYKHPIWYDPKFTKERSKLMKHMEKMANKKGKK